MPKVSDSTIYNWVIYKITNPLKNVYIGQSSSFDERLSKYKRGNCKGQNLLYWSIKHFGWEKHKIEIIETLAGTQAQINEREIYNIAKYKSNRLRYAKKEGLNLTDGGQANRTCKLTEKEVLQIIKRLNKGELVRDIIKSYPHIKKQETLFAIRRGKTWGHLFHLISLPNKLSKKQIEEIYYKLWDGYTLQTDLEKEYNISEGVLYAIKHRLRNYSKHLPDVKEKPKKIWRQLREETLEEIYEMIKQEIPYRIITEKYGTCKMTITKIKKYYGKTNRESKLKN